MHLSPTCLIENPSVTTDQSLTLSLQLSCHITQNKDVISLISSPTFFLKMEARPAPDNEIFSGAGVLPYTVHDGELLFLFHQTHHGRKQGTLIDFGGATNIGETDPAIVAGREFVEETFGCVFDQKHSLEELQSLSQGIESEMSMQQSQFVTNQIETFTKYLKQNLESTKNYKSHVSQPTDEKSWPLALRGEVANIWKGTFDRYYLFFCYVPWKSSEEMTALFSHLSSASQASSGQAEKAVKMRTFQWVPAGEILKDDPNPPLFIRVAAVRDLRNYIRRILESSPVKS